MKIQNIPIWVLAVATMILVLLSIEGGFRLELAFHNAIEVKKESPVSVISGTILGLLAFMLSFTFGIIYNRFDARKELVRDEANAIGTTWRRADFISEPDRGKTVRLLQEYIDLRVVASLSREREKVRKALIASDEILGQLWDIAVANARLDMNSDVAALYIESLNEMINIHNLRMVKGYQVKTKSGVWVSFYVLLILGMFSVGYLTDFKGSSRTLSTLILALSFTFVFVLIATLANPMSGFFKVSQQPMINIQATMAGSSVLMKNDMEDQ